MTVAALYCRDRSVYRALPGVDVWSQARDARLYSGPFPVVAHPPCRMWGKFHYKARGSPEEAALAFHALSAVRRFGGVLEHPVGSRFWREAGLPPPGELSLDGFTLRVDQVHWGHRALKPTWLFFYGIDPGDVPPLPGGGKPVTTVERMWRGEREATPLLFARWLCEAARRARV